MRLKLSQIVLRSILFNRKDAIYQIIIIILLTAVITGSLLTGHSVRGSLRETSAGKIGNTDVIISSGERYFNADLAGKVSSITGEKAISILETEGYCSNFLSGVTALNVKIYGITNDFFSFHSVDSVEINPGEVTVNTSLAEHLGIDEGDEIIIRFKPSDPLPANAPFAPSENNQISKVMEVSRILTADNAGNFSPGISQIIPMTLFLHISDFNDNEYQHSYSNIMEYKDISEYDVNYANVDEYGTYLANRILIDRTEDIPLMKVLEEVLTTSDIGLDIRRSEKTGEPELISDRIFIDSLLVSDIIKKIPSGSPVITYMVNSFSLGDKTTPYSFASALPSSLFPMIDTNGIIINRWLADDLHAKTGDTLLLSWYDSGYGNLLEEKKREFYVIDILDNDSRYSDPLLMPDFPGISGRTTCSGWDAGVPIILDMIREKDEEYWNSYRGTPKAFISYETGRLIWSNNFGSATAIRFPPSLSIFDISSKLDGSINPLIAGFRIIDIRNSSEQAADESVNFSSLFLSLGFFIILSCLILFSLSISLLFDSRKDYVRILYSLGFKNSLVKRLLCIETTSFSLLGAIPGAILGYFVNILVIKALNSVWRGAVQTDALSMQFSLTPVLYGFLITVFLSACIIYVKTNSYIKKLHRTGKAELKKQSKTKNFIWIVITIILSITSVILSRTLQDFTIQLSFIGGLLFFAAMVLILRHYYISDFSKSPRAWNTRQKLSKQFYLFHPAQAIAPVIFIAAGIFAVIITGANRQVLSDKMFLPSGGTGAYQLWAESALPVKEDLNSRTGRKKFGLDEQNLSDLVFVQCPRLSGDDASCLNLNYITTPPILGVDNNAFIRKGSFSFASRIKLDKVINPWSLLNEDPGENIIYGIADQTVLQWGLKVTAGDTLVFRTENGQSLNIVICAGLKSSVFQGYLLIGKEKFEEYFPSVSGNSVFLIDGKPQMSEFYINTLNERLTEYGFSSLEAGKKLASFFVVTNTYLNVFVVFGAFGMVLGVVGLGFVLILNYNRRKREFALLSAVGFTQRIIRKLIINDQIIILLWGVLTGTSSGFIATLPSLISGNAMPWKNIYIMIFSIIIIGTLALWISVRSLNTHTLISQLRRE